MKILVAWFYIAFSISIQIIINERNTPFCCMQLQNGCSFWLVYHFQSQSMSFSFSCSIVYLTSLPPHVGASGHTVSLLAVTVVLVLECSTGGEGN